MPDRPKLPDAFDDGALAEQFWTEVIPRAVTMTEGVIGAGDLRRYEKWLIEGGAIGGAMHAVTWLADHDMIRDPRQLPNPEGPA